MSRLIAGFLPLLMSLSAMAQEAKPEAVEQASPVVVILFAVLFIGSCVGYGIYAWWSGRKEKKQPENAESTS